jgi:hypothetical protein
VTLQRNVGGFDRVLRVVAGWALLSTGLLLLVAKAAPCPHLSLLAGNSAFAWGAIALGLLGLVTGITGLCVLYLPFGISTARPAPEAER